MSEAQFRTVFSSVRPQRVVTFVDQREAKWRDVCLRVIELYSRVWGGNYNLIVPTDGTSLTPAFWRVLETFDPDRLYVYARTGADLKISDPTQFEAIVDSKTREWVEKNVPDEDWTQRRPDFERQLSSARFDDFCITEELQRSLKTRLAPFFLNDQKIGVGTVVARMDPPYPLTPIKDILPHCEHAPFVMVPNLEHATGVVELWAASALGLTSPGFESDVQSAGVSFNNETIDAERVDLLFRQAIAGRGLTDDSTDTVYRFAGTQLERYRRYQRDDPDSSPPMVLVAGDEVADFCLYYSLSRLRGRVFWIPGSWLDSDQPAGEAAQKGKVDTADAPYDRYLLDELQRLALEGPSGQVALTSGSLDIEHLDNLVAQLGAVPATDQLTPRIQPTISVGDTVDEPYRAYEKENIARDATKHVVGQEIAGPFETPKPRRFRTVLPEHRWIAELQVDRYQVPRHPELGSLFIRDNRLGTSAVRAGLTGLAYACPAEAYPSGAELDSILIRPHIRVPAVLEVVQHLAARQGMSCSLSVKGVYELEAIRKFSGLATLADELRHPADSAVLRKFTEPTRSSPGVHHEGVYLKSDGQRYLDLVTLTEMLGDKKTAIALIDKFVAAEIIYRGLILKCDLCRGTSWFDLADIGQRFQCRHCNRRHMIASRHQLRQGDPQWSYKLDQLILRGLQNDMEAPVLTLDWLRQHSRDSFVAAADMDFFESNAAEPFMESDICCFCDDAIVVGEAKKGNRLGRNTQDERKNIVAYRKLSERLGARRVVFSTLSQEWSPTTLRQIGEVFEGLRTEVTLLVRSDLMSRTLAVQPNVIT